MRALKQLKTMTIGLLLLAVTPIAFAHTDGAGVAGGFLSGFTHPIGGLDHVTAMVAVGLWGFFLGRKAMLILPVVFPLVMAGGGVLGLIGVTVPMIEPGIAMSSIVLGLLIALAVKAPLWIAAVIVGAFAIFHGYAHGAELPSAANPLAYSVGFVISTGLLHLAGIAFGELGRFSWGKYVVRAGGALVALAGVGFLTGTI
jgi:urease accessory protein